MSFNGGDDLEPGQSENWCVYGGTGMECTKKVSGGEGLWPKLLHTSSILVKRKGGQ